jgi:cadmium resistance protein CadD (predicted permease)
MTLPELVALGIAAFASTNIDDIFLLMVFFADARFRPLQIVAGQYTGILLLVGISLLAALVALAFPKNLVGLLGLLPIAIGVRQLLNQRNPADDGAHQELKHPARTGLFTVAAVTIANGGDNIGVYVPLFATRPPAQVLAIIVVFAAMAAAWCGAGYWLVHHSAAGAHIRRVGQHILPFVLIGLGVWILAEGFAV